MRLALPVDRTTALKQRLADQLNPSSSEYHKWLTPQQFATNFGATDDQIANATTWLKSQSLSVSALSAAHTTLTVTGTAGQVQAAFAVSLHQMALGSATFYANATQPSLSDDAASLIAGVSGLDNLPAPLTLSGSTATDVPGAIAAALDANAVPVLSLSGTACDTSIAQEDIDTYTALFQQANAQGITIVAASACPTSLGAFPASLAEVTAVTLPIATTPVGTPSLVDARPSWQVAPGLPDDQLRHEPDLTASSVEAFTQTVTVLTTTANGTSRLGNINQTLYDLAPTPGLFTQADNAAAGTWETGSGLGLVDLDKLVKVFPRGTGTSFTSFSASTYSPVHGTSITLSSSVTSGTGGATPTGTVTFSTSAGTLGSGTLNASGTGTFTLNTLPGGNNTITATYNGDATYASSSYTPTTPLYVSSEPLVLSGTPSTTNVIGGTYTVAVTGTGSGVGHPTGNATVTLSGTTTVYTAAWGDGNDHHLHSDRHDSSLHRRDVEPPHRPADGDANFNCVNPKTITVTVTKATPKLGRQLHPESRRLRSRHLLHRVARRRGHRRRTHRQRHLLR